MPGDTTTVARSRATLADWLAPEHIGWSVRHARELLPTERIRSSVTPRALPERIDDGMLAVRVPAHDGDVVLHDLLHDGERDAMVVLHHGEVVCEWLAPGVRSDEQHLMFSITKAVTGLLAEVLAARGLLDLEAPAGDVVPELAGGALGDATVRQLLDMEASFAFIEDYAGDDVRAYRQAVGWYPAEAEAPSLRGYLASLRPDGPHGERFRYLSPAFDAAGWAAAQAAGTTWAEAVERYLWRPAGTELGAYVTLDREGMPRAAGGMCALPRDVARLGLLLAEDGGGVVPPDVVERIVAGGSRERWSAGDFASMWPSGSYRSGWYAPGDDPGVVIGLGIHGQMLYVDRPRQVVVVMLSSWSDADDEASHLDNHAACRTLARSLA